MKITPFGAVAFAVVLGTSLVACSKTSYYRYQAFPEFVQPPGAAPDGVMPVPVAAPPVPQSDENQPYDDTVEVAALSRVDRIVR